MATLAHVLQLVGWWIAPLIIFLVKRDSRFVSFHALQALLLQIVYLLVWGACTVAWMVVIFATVIHHSGSQNALPPMLFLIFPLFWLVAMGLWVTMLVIAIVYGIRAGHGEWAEYPVIGSFARRFLKIGPGGSAIP
jgi:uncharacterized membrane protein